jgi:hypothetical protein
MITTIVILGAFVLSFSFDMFDINRGVNLPLQNKDLFFSQMIV